MRKQLVKYALLSIVLLLAACGKEAEYANVIPSDVTIVASFDCKRILEESGLLAPEKNESQQHFIESFKRNLSAGESELFDQILSNPNEVGVDWSQKAYFFSTGTDKIKSVLLPVIDAEKLKASLIAFGGSKIRGRKFIEEEGYSWASARNFYIALNDKACLLITDTDVPVDALKQRVSLWLNQPEDDSFVSNKYFDDLLDVDGEIGVFAPLSALHENISMLSSLIYSEDMDISTVKYLADISFEKGKIVADGQILYEDKKFREWMHEQESIFKKLSTNSLEFLPKSTPIWFGIGLDGDELYDHLLEHPTYGKKLNNMRLPLDLEGITRSIDGNFTMAYPYGLFIDVQNDQLLRICVGAIETMGHFMGISLTEQDHDQYTVMDQGRRLSSWLNLDEQLSFGMKDDTFYFLTTSEGTRELGKEQSLVATPWADNVDDTMLFLAVNLEESKKLINQYSVSHKQVRIFTNYFNYLTYSQKNIDTNTIELLLVDQDRNVLEQLFEVCYKLF